MTIRRALVIDSIDFVFWGLQQSLNKVFSIDFEYASSLETAISILQKCSKSQSNFDLLILDLKFEKRFSHQNLDFHTEIMQLRKHAPNIRIVGYSADRRPYALLNFIHEPALDGCVLKGQNGVQEMIKAIQNLGRSEPYNSPEISQILSETPPYIPDNYDKSILIELTKGNSQKEISLLFSKTGISPSSLSSIEKRLNLIKDRLKALNNVHLISRAHELGIITLF